MCTQHDTHYFLGANAPQGFYSLYDEFVDINSDNTLYILKGGPGCGKSSFMKTVAEKAGENGFGVEFIHCSGDPNSLDAIYIPGLKTAYVDGTAPHEQSANAQKVRFEAQQSISVLRFSRPISPRAGPA